MKVSKKQILVLTMILILFLNVNNIPNHIVLAESEYEDISDEFDYPTEQLEKLTKVFTTGEWDNKADIQASIHSLDKIPKQLINMLEDNETEIIFIDFPLPDLPELAYLDDEGTPRGYDEGDTYRDDVHGIYVRKVEEDTKERYEAMVTRWVETDSRELKEIMLHELGHAISHGSEDTEWEDEFASTEFLNIHEEEQRKLIPDNDYYNVAAEYFAQAFMYYYYDDARKNELKEKAPKTYQYIEDFIYYWVEIIENSVDGIELSWTGVENADSYLIYRDGKVLAQVTEQFFRDEDYNNYRHDYDIVAIDADGNEIERFDTKMIWTKYNELLIKQYEEEAAKEHEEFEQYLEDSVTLEKLFEKYNIPTEYLNIVVTGILLLIFIGLPLMIVILVVIIIRKKRKKK